MRKIAIACLFVVLGDYVANAGGWVQLKGAGYFQLSQRVTRAGYWFNEDAERQSIRTISNYTTSFYGEYGISNKVTVLGYAPLFVRNTLNASIGQNTGALVEPGDDFNGIGDIDVGIKYGIITGKPTVLSASLTLGLPTGNNTHASALFSGDGEFNQLLMLEFGRSLGKFYVTGGAGVNNRTNDFSDEFRYNFEVGYQTGKFLLMAKGNGVESFFNGSPSAGGSNTGLFANNLEFISFGPEIAWSFKDNMGLSGGATFALSGQKVLAAPVYGLSFFMKLSPSSSE